MMEQSTHKSLSDLMLKAREIALGTLWHDGEESPQDNGCYLIHVNYEFDDVEDNYSDYITAYWFEGEWLDDHFNAAAERVDIDRWISIDELIQ